MLSLLKMGKDVAKKILSVFVIDGLPSYNDAFKKNMCQRISYIKN